MLHRPVCNVKKVLANSEPSTHGPKGTSRPRLRMPALETEADLVESLPTFDFEGLILQCDTRWKSCRVATCGQLSILFTRKPALVNDLPQIDLDLDDADDLTDLLKKLDREASASVKH
jgi:hypothetical protein